MDWNDFCKKITCILKPWGEKMDIQYDDEKISYLILSEPYTYFKENYEELREKCSHYTFYPFTITSDKTFEMLVEIPDMDSRRRFSMNFEDKLSDLSIIDTDNKLSYTFCDVSDDLLWFILNSYDCRRINPRFPYSLFERRCELLPNRDILCIVKNFLRLPYCVSIQSENAISREKFLKYTHSYLFNFAYNLNLVFKPLAENDELFPRREFRNMKRIQNLTELMAPHLNYKQELTEQYNMALISSDPFVQFIGFYHIMEYFFEEVYNKDMIHSVQYIVQHPGFSTKRSKDVIKLIDVVKKKTKQGKEDFQGSELEALELTIKKFINISELLTDLQEYSSESIDYYATNEISFSNGDKIDIRDYTNEKLPKKMAARIYKTRNSLVHSKSNATRANDRGIFQPFKNSQELSKEIPLMRIIAETIIINSATTF